MGSPATTPLTLPSDFSEWDAPVQVPYFAPGDAGQEQLAHKNNNPGNLKDLKGNFIKFDTPEAGYQAIKDRIARHAKTGETLEKYLTDYAPPNENDTETYIKNAESALEKGRGSKVSEIDPEKLAKFHSQQESGTKITATAPPNTLPADFSDWDAPGATPTQAVMDFAAPAGLPGIGRAAEPIYRSGGAGDVPPSPGPFASGYVPAPNVQSFHDIPIHPPVMQPIQEKHQSLEEEFNDDRTDVTPRMPAAPLPFALDPEGGLVRSSHPGVADLPKLSAKEYAARVQAQGGKFPEGLGPNIEGTLQAVLGGRSTVTGTTLAGEPIPRARAAAQAIGGAMDTLTPGMAMGVVAKPLEAAFVAAVSTLSDVAVQKALAAFDTPKEYQELAGIIASIAGGFGAGMIPIQRLAGEAIFRRMAKQVLQDELNARYARRQAQEKAANASKKEEGTPSPPPPKPPEDIQEADFQDIPNAPKPGPAGAAATPPQTLPADFADFDQPGRTEIGQTLEAPSGKHTVTARDKGRVTFDLETPDGTVRKGKSMTEASFAKMEARVQRERETKPPEVETPPSQPSEEVIPRPASAVTEREGAPDNGMLVKALDYAEKTGNIPALESTVEMLSRLNPGANLRRATYRGDGWYVQPDDKSKMESGPYPSRGAATEAILAEKGGKKIGQIVDIGKSQETQNVPEVQGGNQGVQLPGEVRPGEGGAPGQIPEPVSTGNGTGVVRGLPEPGPGLRGPGAVERPAGDQGQADGTRRVTGSADIPLTPAGEKQAEQLSAKQPHAFDYVMSGPEERHLETARNFLPDPAVVDALGGWPRGQHEGQPAESVKGQMTDLMLNPDKRPPGVSPLSGVPGKTYNEFVKPLLQEVQSTQQDLGPKERALMVTSGGNLQAIDAWLKAGSPAGFDFDRAEIAKQPYYSATGKLFKVGPDGLEPVKDNMAPGLYLTEHAATAYNPPKPGKIQPGFSPEQESPVAKLLGTATRKYQIGGEAMEEPDPRAQMILKSLAPEHLKQVDALMEGAKSPSVLSSGFDHVVMDLGNDKVMRLGALPKHEAASDLIAKPSVSKTIGNVGVEIYPKLDTKGITEADVKTITEALEKKGLKWDDAAPDNLGRDKDGNLKIIDGQVQKIQPGFSQEGEGTTPEQAFRMGGKELAKLAEGGDAGAKAEIERRASKKGQTQGKPDITFKETEITPTKAGLVGKPVQGELPKPGSGEVTEELREHLAQTGFDKPYADLTEGQKESVELRAKRRQAPVTPPEKKPVTPQIVPGQKSTQPVASPAEKPTIEKGEANGTAEPAKSTAQSPGEPNNQPLEGELPQASAGTGGGERTPASRGTRSGTGKPRKSAGSSKGPELESSGGTVSGVVGNPSEPEQTFPPRAQDVVSTHHDRDYRIPDGRVVSGSPEARARINIEAIKTLREIQDQKRSATVEEQKILAGYVGWGAVPQLFSGSTPEFKGYQEQLKGLLSDEEYADAQRSTTNAHYTGDVVVDAMWKAMESIGAKPGMSWLEPAVGVGNFLGRQPEALLEGARRVGLDKDSISGQIAQLLYPDSGIDVVAFEDAELPTDYFDGAISNVPFGNFGVHDATFTGKGFLTGSIHNYFFAKALTVVRPGGVVGFITSRYTMDAYAPAAVNFRRWVSDQAHLIGAIRLPSGTFRQNAGTDVITDMIFLRKRLPGETVKSPGWISSEPKMIRGMYGNVTPIPINQYFHEHPEMILGEQGTARGQFSNNDYDVKGTASPEKIQEAIDKFEKIGFESFTPEKRARKVAIRELNAPAEQSKLGGLFFDDKGDLFRKTSKGSAEPVEAAESFKKRIKGQLAIRDALRKLTDAELADKPDPELKNLRRNLNLAYDAYVKSNGPLSSQTNTAAMAGDPDAPLLVSLERRFQKDNKAKGIEPFAEKAPIFDRRMLRPAEVPTSVGDPKEAMYISLNEKGRLDWPRMAELTGRSPEELQQDLAGLVYQDPSTKIWQTAEEYLSGSVRTKLKQAKAIAKLEPQYQANADALEKVQPEDISPGDISALLGVTWVPIDTYSQFAAEMLGADRPDAVKVRYAGGNWIVDTGWGNRLSNANKWSTGRISAVELLSDSLNMRRTKVIDTDSDGNKSTNPDETKAARARQMEMQDHFQKWLFEDPKRGDELVRIYNDTQNDLRLRTYEGAHLTLPGMTRDAVVVRGGDLEPHQKAAVWRGIVQPNVLLAHAVGTGKTFEGIAIGMELKRLGLIQRPMYVVPNATLTSWQNQFAALYPQKRVIVFSEKDLEKSNRRKIMAQIATGDWDAVVVPHSSFQFLPTGDAIFDEHFQKLSEELEEAIREAQEAGLDTRQIKRMEKAKERLLTSLKDKRKAESKDQTVTWEQLGIDQMFVDESHEYKKLGFSTKQGNVAGIDQNGNQKTFDLLMKMRHTQKHGRGVVFMTGTPVTNTMGELYSIMKYLIEPELDARGIGKFDEWAANFGRTVDVFEPKIEGGGYQMKARFAEFVNLPELATLFRSFADVVTPDMVNLPTPEIITGDRQAVLSELTPDQEDYLQGLRQRAEGIRRDPRGSMPDNMLAVYTDAAKMAMDLRMVEPEAPDNPEGRLEKAAEKIHEFWKDSAKEKGAQVVFSDMGKPAEAGGRLAFSAYDELIKKLVEKGIPRNEIAHIYQAKNKSQRAKLFQDINDGKIRVLVASTQKAGVGTNIQERLYALHHMDIPHRPSDLEQREGRILRQGNRNPAVHVLYYMTRGSLDEAKFSNVVRKAKFINQVLQGKAGVRKAEDVGGMVASLAMFQAATSGDPRVMQKMETDAEVDRLSGVYSGWKSQQYKIRSELQRIPGSIHYAERQIEVIKRDIATRDKSGPVWKVGKQKFEGEKISKDVNDALRKQVFKAMDNKGTDVEIGSAHGLPILVTSTPIGPKIEIGDIARIFPNNEEVTSADLFRRITNQIDSLEDTITDKERTIDRAQKDEKALRSSIEETWPYAQKLKDLYEKQQRLVKELGATEGDEAAIAAGEGGEIVDKSVEAQEPDAGEEEGEEPESSEEEPQRESLQQAFAKQAGPVKAQFRDGILWTNQSGMQQIIASVGAHGNATGMYIPADRVRGMLKKGLSLSPALREQIEQAEGGPLPVIQMNPGQSIAQAKATARHELFHAAEQWGGQGRAKELMKHPLAYRAITGLGKLGYTTQDTPLMFSEIGAHLAEGPSGWAKMNLSRDEAKQLFERYLQLVPSEVVSRLDKIAPQLKQELYVERAIRQSGFSVGRGVDKAIPGTQGSAEGRPVRQSLRGDVPSGEDDDEREFAGLAPAKAGERGSVPVLSDIAQWLKDQFGEDAGKVNYSGLGALQTRTVRNLSQLEKASPAEHNAAVRAASSRAQAATMLRAAVPEIMKTLEGGDYSWPELRLAMIEGRLRGLRDRWEDFARQSETMDDEELKKAYGTHLSDLLENIEGKRGLPQDLSQTGAALVQSEQWDALRDFLKETFNDAAASVTNVMEPEYFDDVAGDDKIKKALGVYKRTVEKAMADNHALNEGVFSTALGPLDAYYPLIPTDREQVQGAGRRLPYRKPKNIANKFATGLSEGYTEGMVELRDRLAAAVKANDKAALIDALQAQGLLKKLAQTAPSPDTFTFKGEDYEPEVVELTPGKILVKDGKTIPIPGIRGAMPRWLARELRPILERTQLDTPTVLDKIVRILNTLSLAGPADAVFHTANLLGTLIANTPFLENSPTGKILSAPFAKKFYAIAKIAITDPTTEESARDLIEMAKIGVIPDRYASETYSKKLAEEFGAQQKPPFVMGPLLYGPKGIDIRARLVMYRLAKEINPGASPAVLRNFVNQLGNYVPALQGEIERAMKRTGMSPFITAGSTMLRNGINALAGTGPMPKDGPSMRAWQQLTGGALVFLGIWAWLHHQVTGKWPWEDTRAKIGQIPVPEAWRHSKLGNQLWGKGPEVGYLNAFYFNPLIGRGLRATGATGAFEAHVLHGNAGQQGEAAQKDALNSILHPILGPVPRALFVLGTGEEAYITGLRDRNGRVGLSFMPGIPPKTKPGMPSLGRRTAAAIGELNSFWGSTGSALGESTGFLGEPAVAHKGNQWLRVIIDTSGIGTGLVSNATNPYARETMLRQQRSGTR